MNERRPLFEPKSKVDILEFLKPTENGVSIETKISTGCAIAPFKLMARLTGRGYMVSRLSSGEEAQLKAYGNILGNETLWNQLDPKEKVDLHQTLSDLVYRKTMNL